MTFVCILRFCDYLVTLLQSLKLQVFSFKFYINYSGKEFAAAKRSNSSSKKVVTLYTIHKLCFTEPTHQLEALESFSIYTAA